MRQSPRFPVRNMKKKGVIISITVAVVVLGFLTILFFHDREPRYHGRTLSDWVEDARPQFYAHGLRETNILWQNAQRAVKQMGPDAIPFLLKWIQAADPPGKMKLRLWLLRHPFLHLRITGDDERHKQAMIGFALLEGDGKPAWPILVQWTEAPDSERRFWAFDCLIESQADKKTILPVLVRLSRDPNTLIHDYAARQFLWRYPQEAKASGVSQPPPSVSVSFRAMHPPRIKFRRNR